MVLRYLFIHHGFRVCGGPLRRLRVESDDVRFGHPFATTRQPHTSPAMPRPTPHRLAGCSPNEGPRNHFVLCPGSTRDATCQRRYPRLLRNEYLVHRFDGEYRGRLERYPHSNFKRSRNSTSDFFTCHLHRNRTDSCGASVATTTAVGYRRGAGRQFHNRVQAKHKFSICMGSVRLRRSPLVNMEFHDKNTRRQPVRCRVWLGAGTRTRHNSLCFNSCCNKREGVCPFQRGVGTNQSGLEERRGRILTVVTCA
jgi:hypothetical protein